MHLLTASQLETRGEGFALAIHVLKRPVAGAPRFVECGIRAQGQGTTAVCAMDHHSDVKHLPATSDVGNVLWRPQHLEWTLIDFGCAAQIGAHTSRLSAVLHSMTSCTPPAPHTSPSLAEDVRA
jgi:hypothetical protein